MGLKETLSQWTSDFLRMIYPECCEVCGCALVHGEEAICTGCDMAMPRCNIHTQPFNTIHQRIAGHTPIDKAAGYFYYHRGTPYTRPILAAKYKGRPKTGRILAKKFATELSEDNFFNDIDLIIPVPLHRTKRLKRGYNQAEHIARGLSDVTGISIGNNLVSLKAHSTQTRKNAYERWKNSLDIYSVINPDELRGKHILIVDDIITTGSTMAACCKAIYNMSTPAKISVLSLGVTDLQ